MLQNEDAVCMSDSRESVSDNNGGSAFQKRIESFCTSISALLSSELVASSRIITGAFLSSRGLLLFSVLTSAEFHAAFSDHALVSVG